MNKITFLIAILSFSASSFASKTFVLEGKKGTETIYMFFCDDADSSRHSEIWTARYFHQSSLNDIVLQGLKDSNTYVFYCHSETINGKNNYNEYDEKFELKRITSDIFTGRWTSKNGKSIDIELKCVDINNYENPNIKYNYVKNLKKNDPYNYIRSSFIKMDINSNESIKYNKKEILCFNVFNVPFYQLGKDFNKDKKEIINLKIKEIALCNIIDQLSCATRFAYSKNDGITYNVKIQHLDKDLFSFSIKTLWDCGGAHPDEQITGYLFDLNSGKLYNIDDILDFKPQSFFAKYYDNDSNNASNYREKYFAPKLFSILNKIYKFTPPDTSSTDCNYNDLCIWQYPSWIYTEKGIEFIPSFARYARKCEQSFLVPFAALENNRNLKFPYRLKAN